MQVKSLYISVCLQPEEIGSVVLLYRIYLETRSLLFSQVGTDAALLDHDNGRNDFTTDPLDIFL